MYRSAQPPLSFGLWSVVAGTRKVVPCHMCQLYIIVNCCICAKSGGSICNPYQICILEGIAARTAPSVRDLSSSRNSYVLALALPVNSRPAFCRGIHDGGSEGDAHYFDLGAELDTLHGCGLCPYSMANAADFFGLIELRSPFQKVVWHRVWCRSLRVGL